MSSTTTTDLVKEQLPRRNIFGGLYVRGPVRRELERLGIERSWKSDLPIWFLGFIVVFGAGFAILGKTLNWLSTENAVGLAAAVLTVAGLLVAVMQWRHGLSEKAFDALYQRIALANEMRLDAFKEGKSDDEARIAREHAERYRFYVFTEIDSLEYAARRYRFGLGLNADIVNRALLHFQGRCKESETFWLTAKDCADRGSYFSDTKTLVLSILDENRPETHSDS